MLTPLKKIGWWASLCFTPNPPNKLIICILHRYLHVYLDAHWFREYLYLRSCHPLWSSHQRQSRWRRQSSSEEIVSRNYATSGKGPLCSGASLFAAGYAAAQLSIDKRMSCTASDAALSILRAHYEMQINLLFTLSRETRSPISKKAHTNVWAIKISTASDKNSPEGNLPPVMVCISGVRGI